MVCTRALLDKMSLKYIMAEQNLRAHLSESLARRQASTSELVRRYNGLCDKMAQLAKKSDAPKGAVAPLKIKTEGLFKMDVDHGIWQDLGYGDLDDEEVPRWLASESVREAIRCQLELDRCEEELARLRWERCAIQEWLKREWKCVQDTKAIGAWLMYAGFDID